MDIYKRIDNVALEVKNLDFSITFYKEHFGFVNHYRQVTPSGIQIAYLKLGDTQLELVGRHDQIIGGVPWCLETDDFDGPVSQLKEKKVELLTPPHPTDAREPRGKGWRRVVFKGPDGEQVELRG